MREDLIRDFSLDGRVAVVTGAASGICRDIAVVLAEAGAQIVLADLQHEGMALTASMIADVGGQSHQRRTDVSNRGDVEALADEAVRVMGKVDVWVNGAGIMIRKPILEMAEDDVRKLLAVNQEGVYWGCAAAGRVMKENNSGAIINISSTGSHAIGPRISVYSMTKAAVNALTKAAAKEFGVYGIRVNAVAPGWVETPLVETGYQNAAGERDEAIRSAILQSVTQSSPLALTGTGRDMALAVLYLASEASRFVTGQILWPNGGAYMV
jgi:3-oxoacyl-[acyl-carrier protein] reductase